MTKSASSGTSWSNRSYINNKRVSLKRECAFFKSEWNKRLKAAKAGVILDGEGQPRNPNSPLTYEDAKAGSFYFLISDMVMKVEVDTVECYAQSLMEMTKKQTFDPRNKWKRLVDNAVNNVPLAVCALMSVLSDDDIHDIQRGMANMIPSIQGH